MTEPDAKPSGMSNLLVRVLTAVILGPLAIALVLWENHLGLWLFVLFFNAVGYWEMLSMVPGRSDIVDKVVVVVLTLSTISATVLVLPKIDWGGVTVWPAEMVGSASLQSPLSSVSPSPSSSKHSVPSSSVPSQLSSLRLQTSTAPGWTAGSLSSQSPPSKL